jgi:hypothetical protein
MILKPGWRWKLPHPSFLQMAAVKKSSGPGGALVVSCLHLARLTRPYIKDSFWQALALLLDMKIYNFATISRGLAA